jgi:hypothetical protein
MKHLIKIFETERNFPRNSLSKRLRKLKKAVAVEPQRPLIRIKQTSYCIWQYAIT